MTTTSLLNGSVFGRGVEKRGVSVDELSDIEGGPVPSHGVMRIPSWPMRFTTRFDGSAEPLAVRGDCLAPYFAEGDFVRVNDVEPRDGDLVLLDVCYSCVIDGKRHNIMRGSLKQFRVVAGNRYAVCNQGYLDLDADGTKVCGVVTMWHRPRWWRRPAVRNMRFHLPVRELRL